MTVMQHTLAAMAATAEHPRVALAVVSAVAFAESLAVIGTVVPAAVVMFAAGALVGHGALGLWPVLLVAALGAVLGDGLSYELGRARHERIRNSAMLRRYASAVQTGEHFMQRHGSKSIVLARFTGAVRAFVPLLAGIAMMPRPGFYRANAVSAALWAPAHILPGVLFGSSLQLAEAVSGRLAVLLLFLVAGAWFLQWLVRRTLRLVMPAARALSVRVVQCARRSDSRLARPVLLLLDPEQPGSRALLLGAVVWVAAGWLFLGVLEDLISGDPLLQADHAVFRFLQQLRAPSIDPVVVAITEMGSGGVLMPLIVAVSAWLVWRRSWRTLGYWIANALVGEALLRAVKFSLGRQRPLALYEGFERFSFPSGHVTVSTVVLGFLAFLVARGRGRRAKTAIVLMATAYIAMVALSRLYLGAHWLSDVVGGIGLGLSWVAFLGMVYTHHERTEPIRARGLAVCAAAAIVLGGAFWTSWHGAADRRFYAPRPVLSHSTADGWIATDWQQLPRRRHEFAGDSEEPFLMQWACKGSEVASVLAQAQWRAAPAWTLRSALSLLAPRTALGELPVLPKFDGGRRSTLIFERPAAGADAREVMRLWPSDLRVRRTSDMEVPVWYGALYVEHARGRGGPAAALIREASLGIDEVRAALPPDLASTPQERARDGGPGPLLLACP